MLLGGVQFHIPLVFGLTELLKTFSPITQVTSHTLFQECLAGHISRSGLRDMQHVLVLSYSCLLAKKTGDMCSTILGGIIDGI